MVKLTLVDCPQRIEETARLAHEIWNEHFPEIIGQPQVDYMLNKFQSVRAISQQIENAYGYYLIERSGEVVGYLALLASASTTEVKSSSVQLSKLYLLKAARHQGVATQVVALIRVIVLEQGGSTIWLTVNKYNNAAIKAYHRLGFVTEGDVVADIGGGFVMDDYKMTLRIGSAE